MALWYCPCGAAYAVGLKACPQCGANDPSNKPMGKPASTNVPPGPAENLHTGQVTPAGQPLPEIPPEPDATPLEPSAGDPVRPARRRKAPSGG